MIFVNYFCPSLQSLLQQSVVTMRRIKVVRDYALALLRGNVPDHVLSYEDTTENGRIIFHGLFTMRTIKLYFVKYA